MYPTTVSDSKWLFRASAVATITLTAIVAAQLRTAQAAEAIGNKLYLPKVSKTTAITLGLHSPTVARKACGRTVMLVSSECKAKPIPAQLIPMPDDRGLEAPWPAITALVRPQTPVGCYRVINCKNQPQDQMQIKVLDDKRIGVFEDEKPVLVYNFGTIVAEHVPAKDPRKTRSCYVHPLYGLDGEVLTDDFPRDHFHHHGVFWTWPHVGIEGKQYDLWTDRGGIKQHFVRWLCRQSGPLAAVLAVENGWFVGSQKMVTERVWIRAYKAADNARVIDFQLFFIPHKDLTLQGAAGKSYGGFAIRFAPPSAKQVTITGPQGRTTTDLLNTRLAWADFTAPFQGKPSGAAIFVPQTHPDYPPTWLTRHYGPLAVGWPGVKARTFPAGKPIALEYRVWIHRGPGKKDTIAAAYDAYLKSANVGWCTAF